MPERSICTVNIGKLNYRLMLKLLQLLIAMMYRLKICIIMFAINEEWIAW